MSSRLSMVFGRFLVLAQDLSAAAHLGAKAADADSPMESRTQAVRNDCARLHAGIARNGLIDRVIVRMLDFY